MRVAVIGAGNNGSNHMRCLAAMDDVAVVGAADPERERAEALVAEVGGKAYTDHRAMLDEARPQAVWVSSPCWLHAEHTVDCARAGAHVMCEKPMALSVEDCDRMIAAVEASTVKLMIGLSLRYQEALVALRELFESGRCGELVSSWSVRMGYHRARPGALWRLDGEKSGGIVFEWEVHEIDFVCWFGSPVTEVYARTAHSRAEAPTFLDHFTATLTFRDGGYASLEASQSCTLGRSGRGFVGTHGSAEAVGRDKVRLRTVDMDEPELIDVPLGEHIAQGKGKLTQDADFVRAIRHDAPSPIPADVGRVNVEIGQAIIQSGRTGEPVRLPVG